MKQFKQMCAAVALLGAVSVASAQDYQQIEHSPSAGAMAFDLVVVRPISLVGTVLGTGLWVLQLPFNGIQAAADGEWSSAPGDKLVVEPFSYTFTRPLGQLE
ncbi:hypothetical protein RM530_00245 [Algiphilus sp. W345]|uniref:Uncharacterized protein n=1 Tax=Banduia mediterranea TaxID=3075609 RepID=A0ABU2WD45_9GAMM|nr:hypothetical protein [Algiphilus sp. W345]MDT0495799.1 hypothetical protein [Algiphilus sp. W345]